MSEALWFIGGALTALAVVTGVALGAMRAALIALNAALTLTSKGGQ